MCPDPILPKEKIYGGNNWYYAYGKSSYQEILSDCALQAELAEGLENRPFMVIDDGWQVKHIQGPWTPNEKFGDMKKIADAFKAMGVRPGIWFRPLRDESESIPDEWRFKNRNQKEAEYLDPSHPQVLAHISATVKKMVGWGYELIKHDFSSFDVFGAWGFERKKHLSEGNWRFYDRSKTSAEIYKNFLKTILNLISNKPEINVVFDQVGTPTYALDLANAIAVILQDYATQDTKITYCNSGIYHFSNEGVCSWYDFAKMIAEISCRTNCKVNPCHSSEFPSKVVRPSYSVLDKTKIKTTFAIEVPYWVDSLKKCIANLMFSE
jgi:hypothetical protein